MQSKENLNLSLEALPKSEACSIGGGSWKRDIAFFSLGLFIAGMTGCCVVMSKDLDYTSLEIDHKTLGVKYNALDFEYDKVNKEHKLCPSQYAYDLEKATHERFLKEAHAKLGLAESLITQKDIDLELERKKSKHLEGLLNEHKEKWQSEKKKLSQEIVKLYVKNNRLTKNVL